MCTLPMQFNDRINQAVIEIQQIEYNPKIIGAISWNSLPQKSVKTLTRNYNILSCDF